MRQRPNLRMGIAAVGILTLITVSSVRSGPTEAAWTEAEYAKSNAISATTLTAPAMTACSADIPLLLGVRSVEIRWSSTQNGNQLVEFSRGTTVSTDTAQIQRTGQSGDTYYYRATYDRALLLGLLNLTDLLGSTSTISVFNTAGTNWRSDASTYTLSIYALGLGYDCS